MKHCKDIEKFRESAGSGSTLDEMAEMFGVSRRTIMRWLKDYGVERGPRYDARPGEIWKPIAGWEGYYEVSNLGRVRSVSRVAVNGRQIYGRIRKPIINCREYPYYQVRMWRGGRANQEMELRLVHQLVLETFVGPRPDGMVGCHNNGNQLDNRAENLRWDTPAANSADMVQHGNSFFQKLTAAKVRQIFSRYRTGESIKDLAEHYGVTDKQIIKILEGRAWAHLGIKPVTDLPKRKYSRRAVEARP